jgi:hypothetical protein
VGLFNGGIRAQRKMLSDILVDANYFSTPEVIVIDCKKTLNYRHGTFLLNVLYSDVNDPMIDFFQ